MTMIYLPEAYDHGCVAHALLMVGENQTWMGTTAIQAGQFFKAANQPLGLMPRFFNRSKEKSSASDSLSGSI